LGNELYSAVPLFIHTGTVELLYEDHVKYVDRMRKNGTKVELFETPDAPHDSFGAGSFWGSSSRLMMRQIEQRDSWMRWGQRMEGLAPSRVAFNCEMVCETLLGYVKCIDF
jgi:acetyl esterase/lipase